MLVFFYTLNLPRQAGTSADKLELQAAEFLPLVGIGKSKQDSITHGHGNSVFVPPRGPATM